MNTEKKWNNIYTHANYGQTQVAEVLDHHQYLLPATGVALDLACGLGVNALLLAEKGLETHAVDISTIALNKLKHRAREKNLTIHCQQHDLDHKALPENQYDIIIVSRFLNRALSKTIINALQPQGLLFYQTFTQAKITNAPPNNPEYLLAENELLNLFSVLKIRFYQEYARAGNPQQGNRNEALYIGQKCA